MISPIQQLPSSARQPERETPNSYDSYKFGRSPDKFSVCHRLGNRGHAAHALGYMSEPLGWRVTGWSRGKSKRKRSRKRLTSCSLQSCNSTIKLRMCWLDQNPGPLAQYSAFSRGQSSASGRSERRCDGDSFFLISPQQLTF